ncbi:MAG: HD domain-containing protein [Chitinivibrionales bacterium]|nr:HD domain-containing protein [Chitinivibrionales bacterium]
MINLSYPVCTLDNKQVLPSGCELSPGVMNSIRAPQEETRKTQSLLRHAAIDQDLREFLQIYPYNVIFGDKTDMAGLYAHMGAVYLSPPVCETLDYFKINDYYTYRHIITVFALTTLISRDLLDDHEKCIAASATGPTHDIGKICVPLSILRKTSPLTPEERLLLQHHAPAGYALLQYYNCDAFAAEVALNHHERRDGSGYPLGSSEIDQMVEIVAACDVYDALISVRPYRKECFDNRTALEEITVMAEENKIGWDVVKVLIANNRSNKPHYSEVVVSREKRGKKPVHNCYGHTAVKNEAKTGNS